MNARLPMAGLTIALTLSACGGPPSNSDAQEAFVALLKQSGAGEISAVPEFAVNGCVEAQDVAGYRCDTSGQVVLNIGGRQVPLPISKNLRYVKEDGSWKAYAK